MPSFDSEAPFDELPPLPPREDIETESVLKACIGASRALGELRGLVETVPEQKILLELLPLQESRSSSEIENILSSRNRLFVAAAGGDESDRFTREILRYNQALMRYNHTIPDHTALCGICSIICDQPMDYRRTDDDEVFLVSYANRGTSYTPPSGSNVGRLMNNLMEYIFTDDETDPLIKMAVMHYQFEAIHPFFDGNGRTGRILNILYLQYNKLLNEPILFLSQYIIDRKSEYYRLLRGVTSESAWEPWIIFMLEGVRETSLSTIRTIRGIRKLMTETSPKCERLNIPLSAMESIFSNPFCTISRMQADVGCSRATAAKYLKAMENEGILSSERNGRTVVYRNDGLLGLFRERRRD